MLVLQVTIGKVTEALAEAPEAPLTITTTITTEQLSYVINGIIIGSAHMELVVRGGIAV